MKKRWISLYVENQVGVLSKISGLFSGKSYNLDSLTVGTTEDPTVSRMTIATVSDDETFEQIKKDEKLQHCKVIFLSAKNKESDIEKGIALGADAYMTKPFSIKKVVEKVEELLS